MTATKLTRSTLWPVDKLGRWTIVTNGSTPRRDDKRYWDGGDFPWLNSGVVNRESVTTADQFVTATAMRECHLPVVEPGSLIVALTGQGKTRGMTTMVQIRSTINQHLASITPSPSHWNSRYLLWSLRSAYRSLRATSDETGATKGGLTTEALQRHVLPMPPLDEQRRIAAFLDIETAQIDALIAKQEQLIEILRERRTSQREGLGSHVGQGERLKWSLREVDVRAAARAFELPLMSVSIDWGVRRRDEVTADLARAEDLSKYKMCCKGDIVVNRMRAFQGALGVAPADGIVSPDYTVLRAHAPNSPVWISEAMRTRAFTAEIVRRLRGIGGTESGSVRTPRINVNDLLEIRLDLPGLNQQSVELAELHSVTSKIDSVIAKAEEFIGLAKERRTALITEAVTGKIDVSTGKAREGA